jgi:hypothetical protein
VLKEGGESSGGGIREHSRNISLSRTVSFGKMEQLVYPEDARVRYYTATSIYKYISEV